MRTTLEPSASGQTDGATGGPMASGPEGNRLPAEDISRLTLRSAVLALSVVLSLWGVVTTVIISAVGFTLFIIALCGRIGELRRGP
jgi:hypothetical protein